MAGDGSAGLCRSGIGGAGIDRARVVLDTGGKGEDDTAQGPAVRELLVEQLSGLGFEADPGAEIELKVGLYCDDVARTRQTVTVAVTHAEDVPLILTGSVLAA
ncbi:MAG: hypothetical protein JKY37_21255 [Nannocystaceae bacterium]|nr:hypothetical protein [Nannocystaceae bacterium]